MKPRSVQPSDLVMAVELPFPCVIFLALVFCEDPSCDSSFKFATFYHPDPATFSYICTPPSLLKALLVAYRFDDHY